MGVYWGAMHKLDEQAEAGSGDGIFTPLAVFKHLLFHTWTEDGDSFGWVFPAWSGQARIASSMGCSTKTVRRALGDLETAGMIVRPGRRIYLTWLDQLQDSEANPFKCL